MASLSGCATGKKGPQNIEVPGSGPTQPQPQANGPMGPIEQFGPDIPAPSPVPPPSFGPSQIPVRPVVLVLGPGLARGFAYVGVLKALTEARIPIAAVMGTEMGGLIGSLYANSNSINQFEWALMRFKEDCFQEKAGFLSKLKGAKVDGKKFESQLKLIFGDKDLSQLKFPIKLSFQGKDTGGSMIVGSGPAIEAIRSTMAVPELFPPGKWSDQMTVSAAQSRPFLVAEARSLGLGPVVAVDAVPDSEPSISREELKNADLVLKPDVSGISAMDFQKRNDAAFRGKKVTTQHIDEIRRLVGLSESNSGTDQRSN